MGHIPGLDYLVTPWDQIVSLKDVTDTVPVTSQENNLTPHPTPPPTGTESEVVIDCLKEAVNVKYVY